MRSYIRQSFRKLAGVVAYGLVFTYIGQAAPASIIQAPVVQKGAASKEVIVTAGTQFTVVTIREITSKTVLEGESLEGDSLVFKVDKDVVVDGHTVIAKGTPVKGSVIEAKRAGDFGKGGRLSIRVESTLAVDGQQITLRGSLSQKGDSRKVAAVMLATVFGVGATTEGENARIKINTQIEVYVDEQVKVHVKD